MIESARTGTRMSKGLFIVSRRIGQLVNVTGALVAFLFGPAIAANAAQDGELEVARIHVEINKAEESESGCRLTFLTRSDAGDLARLSLEIAFFDGGERLARLATLAFGEHIGARPKISQFTLEGLSCAEIRSAFVNSESACEGARPGSCLRNLTTTTRTAIDF